jgi:hypothetical protein
LESSKLFDGARAKTRDETIAHSRDPGKLVAHFAGSHELFFMAADELACMSGEALLHKGLKKSGFE